MNIVIHYFASLREEVGCSETSIDSNATSLTVKRVWTLATGQDFLPEKILTAINQEYVDVNATVVDGDEVAFFPPVTGGLGGG
jgi:molybdopterin synthase sulfur carrier subunit